jgi:hypothetical protein
VNSRRSLQRLTLIGCLVVSMTLAATQAAAAACDATWRPQATNGLPVSAVLADIEVLGSGDGWAVGTDRASGLLAHLVNGSWTSARFSVPGRSVSLRGVGAQPGVAWAVGVVTGGAPQQAFVAVNAGSGWRRVQVPTVAASSALNSVAIRSSTDVWISGETAQGRPMALHWTGTRFVVTVLPEFGRGLGIDTVAGDGVVMVGTRSGSSEEARGWHRTGLTWRTDTARPTPGGESAAWVNARSDFGQLWSAGWWGVGCCQVFPFVYRWNGSVWVGNTPPMGQGKLLDLLVTRNGHVIAVGFTSCDVRECSDPVRATIWEWTGSRWRASVVAGLPTGNASELRAVDGDGRGGRWAVGSLNGSPLLLRQCVPSP